MKTYLVAFEYGSGTVWGYVTAASAEVLQADLPEVDVHDAPPAWMSVDEVAYMRMSAISLEGPHCLDRLLAQHNVHWLAAVS